MRRRRPPSLSWVAVGQDVEVDDGEDRWYRCTVLEAENPDAPTSIKVSYYRHTKKWDEWVYDAARVRDAGDDGELLLETAGKIHNGTTGARLEGDEVLFDVDDVLRREGRRPLHVCSCRRSRAASS